MATLTEHREAVEDNVSAQKRFIEAAISKADDELLKALLRKGVRIRDAYQAIECLHTAAEDGDPEMVTLLLQNGAGDHVNDVILRIKDTALHLATRGGHTEVVQVLLDHDADVYALTSTRRCTYIGNFEYFVDENVRALHIAAEEGHYKIAKALLDYNSEIDAMTQHGYTPLHLAVIENNIDIVQLLLQYRALICPLSDDGESVVDIAQRRGLFHIITILEEHMMYILSESDYDEEDVAFARQYIVEEPKQKKKKKGSRQIKTKTGTTTTIVTRSTSEVCVSERKSSGNGVPPQLIIKSSMKDPKTKNYGEIRGSTSWDTTETIKIGEEYAEGQRSVGPYKTEISEPVSTDKTTGEVKGSKPSNLRVTGGLRLISVTEETIITPGYQHAREHTITTREDSRSIDQVNILERPQSNVTQSQRIEIQNREDQMKSALPYSDDTDDVTEREKCLKENKAKGAVSGDLILISMTSETDGTDIIQSQPDSLEEPRNSKEGTNHSQSYIPKSNERKYIPIETQISKNYNKKDMNITNTADSSLASQDLITHNTSLIPATPIRGYQEDHVSTDKTADAEESKLTTSKVTGGLRLISVAEDNIITPGYHHAREGTIASREDSRFIDQANITEYPQSNVTQSERIEIQNREDQMKPKLHSSDETDDVTEREKHVNENKAKSAVSGDLILISMTSETDGTDIRHNHHDSLEEPRNSREETNHSESYIEKSNERKYITIDTSLTSQDSITQNTGLINATPTRGYQEDRPIIDVSVESPKKKSEFSLPNQSPFSTLKSGSEQRHFNTYSSYKVYMKEKAETTDTITYETKESQEAKEQELTEDIRRQRRESEPLIEQSDDEDEEYLNNNAMMAAISLVQKKYDYDSSECSSEEADQQIQNDRNNDHRLMVEQGNMAQEDSDEEESEEEHSSMMLTIKDGPQIQKHQRDPGIILKTTDSNQKASTLPETQSTQSEPLFVTQDLDTSKKLTAAKPKRPALPSPTISEQTQSAQVQFTVPSRSPSDYHNIEYIDESTIGIHDRIIPPEVFKAQEEEYLRKMGFGVPQDVNEIEDDAQRCYYHQATKYVVQESQSSSEVDSDSENDDDEEYEAAVIKTGPELVMPQKPRHKQQDPDHKYKKSDIPILTWEIEKKYRKKQKKKKVPESKSNRPLETNRDSPAVQNQQDLPVSDISVQEDSSNLKHVRSTVSPMHVSESSKSNHNTQSKPNVTSEVPSKADPTHEKKLHGNKGTKPEARGSMSAAEMQPEHKDLYVIESATVRRRVEQSMASSIQEQLEQDTRNPSAPVELDTIGLENKVKYEDDSLQVSISDLSPGEHINGRKGKKLSQERREHELMIKSKSGKKYRKKIKDKDKSPKKSKKAADQNDCARTVDIGESKQKQREQDMQNQPQIGTLPTSSEEITSNSTKIKIEKEATCPIKISGSSELKNKSAALSGITMETENANKPHKKDILDDPLQQILNRPHMKVEKVGMHISLDASEEDIMEAVVDTDQSQIVEKIDNIILAGLANVKSKYSPEGLKGSDIGVGQIRTDEVRPEHPDTNDKGKKTSKMKTSVEISARKVGHGPAKIKMLEVQQVIEKPTQPSQMRTPEIQPMESRPSSIDTGESWGIEGHNNMTPDIAKSALAKNSSHTTIYPNTHYPQNTLGQMTTEVENLSSYDNIPRYDRTISSPSESGQAPYSRPISSHKTTGPASEKSDIQRQSLIRVTNLDDFMTPEIREESRQRVSSGSEMESGNTTPGSAKTSTVSIVFIEKTPISQGTSKVIPRRKILDGDNSFSNTAPEGTSTPWNRSESDLVRGGQHIKEIPLPSDVSTKSKTPQHREQTPPIQTVEVPPAPSLKEDTTPFKKKKVKSKGKKKVKKTKGRTDENADPKQDQTGDSEQVIANDSILAGQGENLDRIVPQHADIKTPTTPESWASMDQSESPHVSPGGIIATSTPEQDVQNISQSKTISRQDSQDVQDHNISITEDIPGHYVGISSRKAVIPVGLPPKSPKMRTNARAKSYGSDVSSITTTEYLMETTETTKGKQEYVSTPVSKSHSQPGIQNPILNITPISDSPQGLESEEHIPLRTPKQEPLYQDHNSPEAYYDTPRPTFKVTAAMTKRRKMSDNTGEDDLVHSQERNKENQYIKNEKGPEITKPSHSGYVLIPATQQATKWRNIQKKDDSFTGPREGAKKARPTSVPNVYVLAQFADSGSLSNLGIVTKDESTANSTFDQQSTSVNNSYMTDPSHMDSSADVPDLYDPYSLRTKSMDGLDVRSPLPDGYEREDGLTRSLSGSALHERDPWVEAPSQGGKRMVVMPDAFFGQSPLARSNQVYRGGDDSGRSRPSGNGVQFRQSNQIAFYNTRGHVGRPGSLTTIIAPAERHLPRTVSAPHYPPMGHPHYRPATSPQDKNNPVPQHKPKKKRSTSPFDIFRRSNSDISKGESKKKMQRSKSAHDVPRAKYHAVDALFKNVVPLPDTFKQSPKKEKELRTRHDETDTTRDSEVEQSYPEQSNETQDQDMRRPEFSNEQIKTQAPYDRASFPQTHGNHRRQAPQEAVHIQPPNYQQVMQPRQSLPPAQQEQFQYQQQEQDGRHSRRHNKERLPQQFVSGQPQHFDYAMQQQKQQHRQQQQPSQELHKKYRYPQQQHYQYQEQQYSRDVQRQPQFHQQYQQQPYHQHFSQHYTQNDPRQVPMRQQPQHHQPLHQRPSPQQQRMVKHLSAPEQSRQYRPRIEPANQRRSDPMMLKQAPPPTDDETEIW